MAEKDQRRLRIFTAAITTACTPAAKGDQEEMDLSHLLINNPITNRPQVGTRGHAAESGLLSPLR